MTKYWRRQCNFTTSNEGQNILFSRFVAADSHKSALPASRRKLFNVGFRYAFACRRVGALVRG